MRFPRSRVVSLCSVALCVLTCVVAEGRRVKVRHAPVVAEAEPAFADIPRQVTDADTLTMIRIFGYDKPLSSDRESMFLTSGIDSDTICGIELRIDYLTTAGVCLHTRTLKLPCEVPGGQTRRLVFKSWDETNTFYYFCTPPRTRKQVTPYTVKVRALSVLLK